MYTSSSSSRAEPRYPVLSARVNRCEPAGGRADGRTDGRTIRLSTRTRRETRRSFTHSTHRSSPFVINANHRRIVFFSPTLVLPFRLVTVIIAHSLLFFWSRGFFPRAFSLMHDSRLNRSTSTARVRGRRGREVALAWSAIGTFIPAENRGNGSRRYVRKGINSPRCRNGSSGAPGRRYIWGSLWQRDRSSDSRGKRRRGKWSTETRNLSRRRRQKAIE